jgi:hypothetical protein
MVLAGVRARSPLSDEEEAQARRSSAEPFQDPIITPREEERENEEVEEGRIQSPSESVISISTRIDDREEHFYRYDRRLTQTRNSGDMMDNIIVSKLYRPGSVGYVSKSGGMSTTSYPWLPTAPMRVLPSVVIVTLVPHLSTIFCVTRMIRHASCLFSLVKLVALKSIALLMRSGLDVSRSPLSPGPSVLVPRCSQPRCRLGMQARWRTATPRQRKLRTVR